MTETWTARAISFTAGLKRGAVVLSCAVMFVLVGCGGSSTPKLTTDEETRIANVEVAFATTDLDGGEFGSTLRGVDFLVRMCRTKAAAVYAVGKDSRTVKQVTEDGANTLRDSQPDLAAKLDRVLDDGCK